MTSFYGAARTTEATLEVAPCSRPGARRRRPPRSPAPRPAPLRLHPQAAIPGVSQHLRLPGRARLRRHHLLLRVPRDAAGRDDDLLVQRPGLLHQGRRPASSSILENLLGCPWARTRPTTSSACTWASATAPATTHPRSGSTAGRRGLYAVATVELVRELKEGAIPLSRCRSGGKPDVMPSYAELQRRPPRREPHRARTQTRIAVGIDTSSIAPGAQETLDALSHEVARRGIDAVVDQVGGNGLSFANPRRSTSLRRRHRTAPTSSTSTSRPPTSPAFVDAVAGQAARTTTAGSLGALHGTPGRARARHERPPLVVAPDPPPDAGHGRHRPREHRRRIARGAYAGLDRALTMTPGRGHRRGHRLQAQRPQRRLLPHGPQVGLPAHLAPPRPRPWSATPTRATPAPGSTA